MFFLAQPKASNFELKSPTNMTLSERLLMVLKSLRLGFPLFKCPRTELEVGIFAQSAMVDQARECLCYQRET